MLTIYAPPDKPKSKCWEVFDGIKKTWSDIVEVKNNTDTNATSPAMFWGFVNNNINLVHQLEQQQLDYWYTDTPYFGRFDNNNLKEDNHYWRICKNQIHARYWRDCPSDRFNKFNLKIKTRDKNQGEYILICPSSVGIHTYLKKPNWLEETIATIKKYTDRPIKIREKPRKAGTSGPAVADVPLEQDLQNSWACVTSCSISAVAAVLQGVPVFSDPKSFAWPMASASLSEIEDPFYTDPSPWLHSLACQQFTPQEFANGTAVGILKEIRML
jgi:hypothetical protein